jgi:hypothetical protein
MKGTVPNPSARALRPVELVTDRALRYRANRQAPPEPRHCHYCGNPKRRTEVEHVDGHEENTDPRNLTWACRSCNTRKGAAFSRAGCGRKTRQFNPRRRNAEGARSLAQWLNAVLSLKGQGGTMALPDAITMVHATPHSRRSEFAREIWNRRRQHGGGKEEVPF